eukprot:maker-scaffold33_size549341-snap-gene-4.34 protein:Tk11553 transcript:maker-scaffold33_size549341-snap-gene-4.34-mRNA-1 annotation:"hypothetical protein"
MSFFFSKSAAGFSEREGVGAPAVFPPAFPEGLCWDWRPIWRASPDNPPSSGADTADMLTAGDMNQATRAALSSLNELTVHAVAMETWRAFHSQDGPVLFPSNVATRSTRSEAAGVVSPHLPYAANTLVDNGIAVWNKFPALLEAPTKRMASNVAKSISKL